MTAGQAFEALNNAGDMPNTNLLVILNDNEMSISPNVGALPKYLVQSVMRDFKGLVKSAKTKSEKVFNKVPGMMDVAKKVESKIKEAVDGSPLDPHVSLFEKFGFDYTGPIDGHDVALLVKTLKHLRSQTGPQLLHIVTKKVRATNWQKTTLSAFMPSAKWIPTGLSNPQRLPNRLTRRFLVSGCVIKRLPMRVCGHHAGHA